MRRIPVISQAIASVGYDGARHALEIEFTSGGVYRYEAVPLKIYEELMSAESHGSYFMARIRGRYLYAKLLEERAPKLIEERARMQSRSRRGRA